MTPASPALFHDVKIRVYASLLNLQDLLRFRVTVGLSIFRNMIFVSLCRLVVAEQRKELISVHCTVMANKSSRLYLVRCSTSNELMRPTSFVFFRVVTVVYLKYVDGGQGDYEYWEGDEDNRD
jgi:hypothetical protein